MGHLRRSTAVLASLAIALTAPAVAPAIAATSDDARVSTPLGRVNAGYLNPGDDVLVWPGTDAWEPQRLSLALTSRPDSGNAVVYLRYQLPGEDDDWIVATFDQPVLTARGVVPAARLLPGDQLKSNTGWAQLREVTTGLYNGPLTAVGIGGAQAPTSDPRGHIYLANGIAVGDFWLATGLAAQDETSKVLDRLLACKDCQPTAQHSAALPLSTPSPGPQRTLGRHTDCVVNQSRRLEVATPTGHWVGPYPHERCRPPRSYSVTSTGKPNEQGNIHVGVVCPRGYRVAAVTSTAKDTIGTIRKVRLSTSAVYVGAANAQPGAILGATGTCRL